MASDVSVFLNHPSNIASTFANSNQSPKTKKLNISLTQMPANIKNNVAGFYAGHAEIIFLFHQYRQKEH